ncbi:hypothetical protein ES703_17099 [subsurface metagenome]
MGHRLRGAEGGTLPVVALTEGGSGAAADEAVVGAAPTGKHRGDGIAQPVPVREITGQVAVTDYRAHRVVVVVNEHPAELIGDMRKRVLVHLPATISPGKIGYRGRFAIVCDALHQLAEWLLGGVAPEHIIDLGVIQKLLVIVGGGESAEDQFCLWVMPFYHPAYLDGAVGVEQPVKVDAEYGSVQALDKLLGVEFGGSEHADRQVHDTHTVASPFQVLRDAGKAYGIELENRGGGDEVAGRTIEDGLLTKVVDARRVK